MERIFMVTEQVYFSNNNKDDTITLDISMIYFRIPREQFKLQALLYEFDGKTC